MASAKPGVHIVQLKPVSVPKYMIEGEKWVKWEEETNTPQPVTLKVDENGFFLYWTTLNKETDLLDIATIRDTRTSNSARLPRDPKLRQLINYGSTTDSLEDKTLTVVTGPDFVNLSFYTFTTERRDVARQWTSDLLKLSTNLLQLNSPVISFLKKIHTKLLLLTDKTGKIPVKNVVKVFTQDKQEKKRVERVLGEVMGWGGVKTDSFPPTHFPFHPTFFTFYTTLTNRTEVLSVFQKLTRSSPTHLTPEEFMDFINREQRDPRLNEILYPYATEERARELIGVYEGGAGAVGGGAPATGLSFQGFLRYILSEDNAVVSYEKYDLSDDMDQPLCHYFINSSHNTYLTGHQLTGKSSVEMYRQALLAGCRCVELDFWNGKMEEPVIVHGYTLVPDIPARDVLEAIAESAFKTSDYPVILSFENHCNPKQQAKIAGYCREFFGGALLEGVLEGWPLTPDTPLPPPSALKNKIIIKNKKKHHHHHHHHHHQKKPLPATPTSPSIAATTTSTTTTDYNDSDSDDNDSSTNSSSSSSSSLHEVGVAEAEEVVAPALVSTDKGTAGKESEAGAEISALVNYVQPVHFYSFEASCARSRSYEMSSFDEKQATSLLKLHPVEFVNYNKHQLSRVYPRGTRVDSANFMPQLFWNAGCQLVALNYQTMDLAMQLNMGIFELNRRCGYLLKPEFMRRKDRSFDPFAESTVDGIIAGTVGVRIISAQFLYSSRSTTTRPYIEAEMYGLPTDTIRKKFRTRPLPTPNSINPIFDDQEFLFKKIVLPELACIRLVAYEENGRPIGHRVIPVIGLRPGYRHIVLRNESGQPLALPGAVFVHISVRDYVPDGLSDFAEALANPIKYQNELERRGALVGVLMDEEEEEQEDEDFQLLNQDSPAKLLPQQPHPSTSTNPLSAPPIIPRNISIKKKPSTDSTTTTLIPTTVTATKDTDLSGPPPPLPLATYGGALNSKNCVNFSVDSFDSYLNNKAVREKMGGVVRKVEQIRRGAAGGGVMGKKILVKKLSKMDLSGGDLERMEREVVERGVEEITRTLTKQITDTHSKQSKLLSTLKERQTNEIMKWIYTWRKDEYRRLSKLTKDKNELGRMKREVNNVLVNKGVTEREKVETTFSEIERLLVRDQEGVFKELEKWRGGDRGWVEEGVGSLTASGSGGGVVQLLKFSSK